MFNTNQFYHNGRKKIFTANTKNIEFDVPFTNESNGAIIELQSHKTNNVTKWQMVSLWYRHNEPYSMKFVPIKESVDLYPRLEGYRMVVYNVKENTK